MSALDLPQGSAVPPIIIATQASEACIAHQRLLSSQRTTAAQGIRNMIHLFHRQLQELLTRLEDTETDQPAPTVTPSSPRRDIEDDTVSSDVDILSISSDEDAPAFDSMDVQASQGHSDGEAPLPPSNQQVLQRQTLDTLSSQLPQHSTPHTRHSRSPNRGTSNPFLATLTFPHILPAAAVFSPSASSAPSVRRHFPSRSPTHLRQLVLLVRVLEEMYCATLSGRLITKRDIYYRSPAFFPSQQTVDRLCEEIAEQIGVRRSALGVSAAPKGLVAGNGTIRLLQRPGQDVGDTLEVVELSHHQEALIPSVDDVARVQTQASWVLVVEKEAVFKTLLQGGITSRQITSVGEGMIVTGKGYPDFITKEFLTRLWQDNPHILLFALVDHDPFGLHIYEQYLKSIPPSCNMRLMGLRARDVQSLPSPTAEESLLPLKRTDRTRAEKMLAQQSLNATIRNELEAILSSQRKAELEILSISTRRRQAKEREDQQESSQQQQQQHPFPAPAPAPASSRREGIHHHHQSRGDPDDPQAGNSLSGRTTSEVQKDGLVRYVEDRLKAMLRGEE